MVKSSRKVAIVGGGIVGSCLAQILSATEEEDVQVTLFERGGEDDRNSTELAPGITGQFNTIDCLRILAQRSVKYYKTMPDAFAQVGGLEVAFTQNGLQELKDRFTLAQKSNQVEARWVTGEEACQLEPNLLIKEDDGTRKKILGGIFFPSDGTTNPKLLLQHQKAKMIKSGVKIVQADVISIGPNFVLTKNGDRFEVDDVVLCSGIWTKELINDLPVYPVAHPYTYSEPHSDPIKRQNTAGPTPFIRWPEIHAYARDHGAQYGFGSYNHVPILSDKQIDKGANIQKSAKSSWIPLFTDVLQADGQKVLKKDVYKSFNLDQQFTDKSIAPIRAFNGVFAVTPDLKPLAGLYETNGNSKLFTCVAVWVTQAFGTAQLVAKLLLNKELNEEDITILKELDPRRFKGVKEEGELRKQSLAMYNDIYAKGK